MQDGPTASEIEQFNQWHKEWKARNARLTATFGAPYFVKLVHKICVIGATTSLTLLAITSITLAYLSIASLNKMIVLFPFLLELVLFFIFCMAILLNARLFSPFYKKRQMLKDMPEEYQQTYRRINQRGTK